MGRLSMSNGWCPVAAPARRSRSPPTMRSVTWWSSVARSRSLGEGRGTSGRPRPSRKGDGDAGGRKRGDGVLAASSRWRQARCRQGLPCRGDRTAARIRWTRNDARFGLVNSRAAGVEAVKGSRVSFRLEDGRTLELSGRDPQFRRIDHAWAPAVHAFHGRRVDKVIAVMEASHPRLTTQKSLYLKIGRARQ